VTDIRQVLETAFDDEPPSNLDKSAIVRAGRRRLGARRATTAGAVLAAVTAVGVPVVLAAGGGASVAPVASQPATAEPAPVGSSARRPPTIQRAAELSALLANSGALPEMQVHRWSFGTREEGYLVRAELGGGPAGELNVRLADEPFECGAAPADDRVDCETRQYRGVPVVVRQSGDGASRSFKVSARTADGGVLSAEVVTGGAVDGRPAPPQPLTYEQVAKLATVPGVTF